ncbi:hypothetical protein [Arthrobacter sp. ZGTC412]|nr:hypothetical protein [Arthrobacter sp. ZGTC412]
MGSSVGQPVEHAAALSQSICSGVLGRTKLKVGTVHAEAPSHIL